LVVVPDQFGSGEKDVEVLEQVRPEFRMPGPVLGIQTHRLDLILDRQYPDVVQNGRVHQVGLLLRAVSHGLCEPKRDVGHTLRVDGA
jgi:hypothetical protein